MSTSAPRPRRRARGCLHLLLRLLLVGTVLLALVAGRSWYEVTHTHVEQLRLTSSKLQGRPLRVLQVTDLHDVQFTPQRDELVRMVVAQQPDLVAITGDLVNTYTTEMGRIDAWLGALEATGLPVYAVPGNHDHFGEHYPAVLEVLRRHHVTVLLDRHIALDGPWGRLDLVGTDDYHSGNGDLAAAMRGTRPDAYRLVLTHAPEVVRDLAGSGADLAICGHTHGGQVRVPGAGALVAPGQGWFPRYDKGLFTVGDSLLYVDSGVGQSIPLRLNAPSQMTLLTITPA